ncbi:MAG TPA: hypothetical protein VKB46_24700 [Pyrinomonadaceae bacterium]|nr:hypothetical protein [Pyrinomonadaceae bacterium]
MSDVYSWLRGRVVFSSVFIARLMLEFEQQRPLSRLCQRYPVEDGEYENARMNQVGL